MQNNTEKVTANFAWHLFTHAPMSNLDNDDCTNQLGDVLNEVIANECVFLLVHHDTAVDIQLFKT